MGKYLRTNYRLTGGLVDPDAIGGGAVSGSWLGGAGTRNAYGGFVVGSITVNNSILTISAYGALNEYFGNGMFTSGYKVLPIAWHVVKQGSAPYDVYLSLSFNNSAIPFIPYRLSLHTASQLDYATGVSISAKVIWCGFIVSTP